MKKLFFVFLMLLLAIGLGFLIHEDPGYVMVSFKNWIIATSVWVAAITLILAFLLLYFLVRFLKNTASFPKKLARRWQWMAMQKSHLLMTQGLAAFEAGCYMKAEKYFVKAAHKTTSAHALYLLAARAAQAQWAEKRRDAYLKEAIAVAGKETVSIALTRADLLMSQAQYAQAQVILTQLHADHPKNTRVIDLLLTVYLAQTDWQKLLDLLPLARNCRVRTSAQLNQLEIQAYQHVDPPKGWVNKMLKHMPNDVDLLLIATRESLKAQFFGQAKSHIEKAITLDPSPVAYYLLAKVYLALGESDKALSVI